LLHGEQEGKAKDSQRSRAQEAVLSFARRLPGRTEVWFRKLLSDYANVQAVSLWIAALLTGIVAVGYAQIFKSFELLFFSSLQTNPWLAFVAPPAALFVSAWLVKRFAPESRGSGIPQVMAAIDLEYEGPHKPFVDKLLSFKVLIVKIFSSLIAVLGGGAIGREGPTLQVSASIFHLCGRFVRRFYPQSDEKIWVIAGASAGLASAFNTPLGGIVYAIEEIGRDHFQKVRTVLLSSVIISGLVAQWLLGSYLYLGYPKLQAIELSVLPYAALVGIITGTLGALFGKALFQLTRLSWRKHWSFALVCGLGLGGLIYFEPLSSGSGVIAINDILFNNKVAEFHLFLFRAAANMLTYLSGAAGGIFSPALASGAVIGSYLSDIFGSGQSQLMALLGMIGFLTGITYTPFTSFILVLEMTDRHSAIFPMMLTALVAHGGARAISQFSFYELLKEQYLGRAKGVVH
jgi:H+/Cl- antiporter ClcA